jgi:hypothetical protein
MNGTLSEGVLPEVLRALYVGRKTGILRCYCGDERRGMRLLRGTIIDAETNVTVERLGEILVKRGLITENDLARATEIVIRDKRRLGEVLIEMGALDQTRLEDGMAFHVKNLLTRVFAWNEGTYEFEEQPEMPIDGALTLKLSPGELILDAVRAIHDPDVIRYSLGDIDRTLQLSTDPLLRFQKLTLSPTDGFVLSRVDGATSAREVIAMMSLPPEETQKSLFGLVCTGIIEFTETTRRGFAKDARSGPAGRSAEPRPATPAPPVSEKPAPTYAPPPPPPEAPSPNPVFREPSPPPPPAPLPPPPKLDPASEARRQEILEIHAGLKTRTHFEILGIPRASTEVQVKEAYFRLAKRFHPDVHHDPSLSDLRDRLEAIFIRLGEAYETLRNPRTRAAYEERLGSSARVQSGGDTSAPAASPAPAADPHALVRAAELQVRLGEKLIEQEKYWDAIQSLEPAIPVVTGKMKSRARVSLSRAYLKNPKWVKRAEETLLVTIQEDPQNVDGHLLLGRIYKERGLKTRSLAMFRRVIEIKPDHEEAAAELLEAEPEPKPESGGGGFMKKIFGKKP